MPSAAPTPKLQIQKVHGSLDQRNQEAWSPCCTRAKGPAAPGKDAAHWPEPVTGVQSQPRKGTDERAHGSCQYHLPHQDRLGSHQLCNGGSPSGVRSHVEMQGLEQSMRAFAKVLPRMAQSRAGLGVLPSKESERLGPHPELLSQQRAPDSFGPPEPPSPIAHACKLNLTFQGEEKTDSSSQKCP